jgi:3-hydroxybutyryl-CoA dehydrogenase
MGSGIAHAFLVEGCHVVVIEADDRAADAARTSVRANLERSAARGTLKDGSDAAAIERAMARLASGTDDAALRGAGLVIEAVPEDLSLKRAVIERAAAATGHDAILASNTSSISIDALSRDVPVPGRFLGMHFFNPVPASLLVEIVTGTRTTDSTAESARGWARAIGKTPVTVRDSPGFASSRLGVALGLEAIRMIEEGVASAEDIDAAMTLGYKHPVGPLRLTDMVGLDVRLAIAEYLSAELGERFAPPTLLREKVAAGQLGQKSGQGFYNWTKE